ncbi:MAG: hypothetical protein OXH75_18870 [Acidobacteria bacterium]|nr:hypothetical protein [Acidobacteriota bacterium]
MTDAQRTELDRAIRAADDVLEEIAEWGDPCEWAAAARAGDPRACELWRRVNVAAVDLAAAQRCGLVATGSPTVH